MAAVLSPASNMTFGQSLTQRQISNYDNQRSKKEPKIAQQQGQPSIEMELKQRGSPPEEGQFVVSLDVNPPPLLQRQYQDNCHQGQTEQVPFQNPQTTGIPKPGEDMVHNHEPVETHDPSGELQYLNLQKMSQQATVSEQPSFEIKHTAKVIFSTLLPLLLSQLPKDRAMKFQTMFMKLKLSSQMPSNMSGNDARTLPKKPNPGRKKPLEALDSSPPPVNKKQKVSRASPEESMEQLNDVNACSGVDLREEQEHLLPRHREDIRV